MLSAKALGWSLIVFGVLAPGSTWSQPAAGKMPVGSAYVAILPTGSTEIDFVLALQRGIELVFCQSGIRSRPDASEAASDLKLTASLMKADFETDLQARELVRECELTQASATLPGGASVPLPDVALSGRTALPRSGGGRRASESFFLACGANFARTTLDALKDKVSVRPSSCEDQPQPARKSRRK